MSNFLEKHKKEFEGDAKIASNQWVGWIINDALNAHTHDGIDSSLIVDKIPLLPLIAELENKADKTVVSKSADGLAPQLPDETTTTKYLRQDATWATPPNTTYSNFIKSGSTAANGLVPSPGTTAGTTKFLCEDATWKAPSTTPGDSTVTNASISSSAAINLSKLGNATLTDADESRTLPATTSSTITTLLQTIRNNLKYLINNSNKSTIINSLTCAVGEYLFYYLGSGSTNVGASGQTYVGLKVQFSTSEAVRITVTTTYNTTVTDTYGTHTYPLFLFLRRTA
jgi:hypothetical protein